MNEKLRAAKEAIYEAQNKDVKSVCSGQFYKKGSKSYEQCEKCENCHKYKSYKDKSDDTPEVKFHYVDTFRKCEFYKYRPMSDNEKVQTAIYNILYVNDMAYGCVLDLQDYMHDADKETIKIYHALTKRMNEYINMINGLKVSKTYFLSEYNYYMDEYAKPKLEHFTLCMRNAIKDATDKNIDFITTSEIARMIVGYSVLNVENRIKECLKIKKDSFTLRQYEMNEAKRIMENLSRWICRKCNITDLNNYKDLVEAYRDLDKTLTNPIIINECLLKAKNET